jgi:hypothetical protein
MENNKLFERVFDESVETLKPLHEMALMGILEGKKIPKTLIEVRSREYESGEPHFHLCTATKPPKEITKIKLSQSKVPTEIAEIVVYEGNPEIGDDLKQALITWANERDEDGVYNWKETWKQWNKQKASASYGQVR